jgi:hypothetical protein
MSDHAARAFELQGEQAAAKGQGGRDGQTRLLQGKRGILMAVMEQMIGADRRIERALGKDLHRLCGRNGGGKMPPEPMIPVFAQGKDEQLGRRLRRAGCPDPVVVRDLDDALGRPEQRAQDAGEARPSFNIPVAFRIAPFLERCCLIAGRRPGSWNGNHRVPGIQ